MTFFPVSPGDVKWSVMFMILLGVIFLAGTWKSWMLYKASRRKTQLAVLVFFAQVTLAMIPAEMVLRSYTSATIVLDETGVKILCRPVLKDQGLAYEDIRCYQTTTLAELGGVSRSSGYSNGIERIGWFKMHKNGRKVFVCAVSDNLLLVEGKNSDILLLAPPDMDRFLEAFEQRMRTREEP